jgi:hypothetical protein
LLRAVEAARRVPAARDDIAWVVLRLAGDDETPVPPTEAEQAAIAASKSKAAAARGEFPTDEQVASARNVGQVRPLRLCHTLPADLSVILD